MSLFDDVKAVLDAADTRMAEVAGELAAAQATIATDDAAITQRDQSIADLNTKAATDAAAARAQKAADDAEIADLKAQLAAAQPPKPAVLLGAYPGLVDNGKTAESNAARVARVTKAFGGTLKVSRWYDSGRLNPEPDMATVPQIISAALPASAVAGSYDKQLTADVAALKVQTWVCPVHEPDNNKMTGPQYVALHRHFHDVVKAVGNPMVKVIPILMSYTLWHGGQAALDAFYPGDEYVDAMGWDCYIRGVKGKTDTPANALPPPIQYSLAHDKPTVFGEFGIVAGTGNTDHPDSQWPSLIADSLAIFTDPANRVDAVAYFETHKTDGATVNNYKLEDRPAALALWVAASGA